MNIIKDFKNELLNRREIKMIVENSGNPGFANSIRMVAEKFKAEEDVIVVKNVRSKFGRGTFLIDVYLYDSKEDKSRIEEKPKQNKKGGNK